MKSKMAWLAAAGFLAAIPLAGNAQLASIPMNAQINNGFTYNTQSPNGDAIYVPSFSAPDTQEFIDDFNRHHCTGNAWWYHYIDLNLAGVTTPGNGLDLSGPCTRIEFDTRYFQDPNTNTNPYGDAPVFVRIYTYAADGETYVGHRDYSIVYATQAPWSDPPYPDWTRVTVFVNNASLNPYADGGTFDVTNVSRIRFYGTDWAGTGDDFVDFRNFQIWDTVLPPTLAEVTPDPDIIFVDTPYSRQVVNASCDPNLMWSLVTGPPGLTIDQTGTVSGWTPGQADANQTFNITVEGSNAAGSDTESWQVLVKAPIVPDGSNVAAPWGTIHGNLSGTQSSDDPAIQFSDTWSNGVQIAWTFSDVPGGTERGGISFDEQGNVYWKSNTGVLASVAPDGTHRWNGNSGGSDVALGLADSTTPVVGDGGPTGRVYALSDTGIAAFRKSDGVQLWAAPLPDANFADGTYGGNRLTPVLYGGVLYVVGVGSPTKTVYAVNAADGEIIFARQIAVTLDRGWGDAKGQMTFVPDIFGAGQHGLYFNADGGSGTGNALYAIAVDSAAGTATLQFAKPGAKSAKSHPVYSAVTNRIYTAGWGDYGNPFFSFDAVTGDSAGSASPDGGTFGFNDFAALDFNGTDVLAAGSSGNVAFYHDNGDGTTTATFYPLNSEYGEYRMYGGLYKSTAGNTIAVMATRESGSNERVIAFDATAEPRVTCFDHEDAGVYVDNLKITTGATGTETTLLDTSGFEGYALGNLPGQGNPGGVGTTTWEDDTAGGASAVGMVQVVGALPAGGVGKGILVDATGGCGGFQGVFAPLASAVTTGVVVATWDQYRGDLTDNLWLAENIDYSGWWTLGWDQNGSIFPRGFDGTAVPMTAGVWQHMQLTLDFVNNSATISVDGNSQSFSPLESAELQFRGWDIEVEGTFKDDDFEATPIGTIFNYDTGLFNPNFICGLQMGPVVAGAQQLYYFTGPGGTLIALKGRIPLPGDFDDDGDVDTDDLIPFVNCDEGPMVPVTDPECAEEDMNDDGFVDMLDFAGWQNCFSGPGNPGDPECYP